MRREEVYSLLDLERFYQDGKWGGPNHDKEHSVGDWIVFMEVFLDRAKQNLRTGTKLDAIEQIMKVTALGVACMESQLEEGESTGYYRTPEVTY